MSLDFFFRGHCCKERYAHTHNRIPEGEHTHTQNKKKKAKEKEKKKKEKWKKRMNAKIRRSDKQGEQEKVDY